MYICIYIYIYVSGCLPRPGRGRLRPRHGGRIFINSTSSNNSDSINCSINSYSINSSNNSYSICGLGTAAASTIRRSRRIAPASSSPTIACLIMMMMMIIIIITIIIITSMTYYIYIYIYVIEVIGWGWDRLAPASSMRMLSCTNAVCVCDMSMHCLPDLQVIMGVNPYTLESTAPYQKRKRLLE